MTDRMPQDTPADNTARCPTEPGTEPEIAEPCAAEGEGEASPHNPADGQAPALLLYHAHPSYNPPTIEFELDQNAFDIAMHALALTGKAKRRTGRYQDGFDLNIAVKGDCVQFTATSGWLTWQAKAPVRSVSQMTDLSSFSTSLDRMQALATFDMAHAYDRPACRKAIPETSSKQTHETYFEPAFYALLVRRGELPEVSPQPQLQQENSAGEEASRIHFAFFEDEKILEITAGGAKLNIAAAAASPHAALVLPDEAKRWFDPDVTEKLALATEYVRPFAADNSGQFMPRTITVSDGSVRGGSHLAISRAGTDCLAGLAFDIDVDTAKPFARLIAKQAGFWFAKVDDRALFEGPTVSISFPLSGQEFPPVDDIFKVQSAKGSCALVEPIRFASTIAVMELAARPRVPAPNVMIYLSFWQSENQTKLLVESVEPAGLGRAIVSQRTPTNVAVGKEPSGRAHAKQLKRAIDGMLPDRPFELTLSDSAVMVGFDTGDLTVQHALSYNASDGPGPIRPLPADFLDKIYERETRSDKHRSRASSQGTAAAEPSAGSETANNLEQSAGAAAAAEESCAETALTTASGDVPEECRLGSGQAATPADSGTIPAK